MDPIKNPFSPGAGSPPPELVGRDTVIEQARILLGRVKQGRPEKSMLLTGLRGVGKTVLLNRLERMASEDGYLSIIVEAHEDKPLGPLLVPSLRTALFQLDRMAGTSDRVKRGLAVLRGFISAMHVTVEGINYGLDIEPEVGTADSGDLEIDLPNLFVAIGEAAQNRSSALAILVDEIQFFDDKEFASLIMAMHKVQQKQLPIVLLGAGLPILPRLAGESKSYAERLFSFPNIGALSASEAAKALQDPAQDADIEFEQAALDEVFRLTKGYPYFIQEWGYQAWNMSCQSPITKQTIEDATKVVTPRLDENFFRVRYDRLTPSEKRYLRAMAELGHGPQRTGEIADMLNREISSLGPVRGQLIHKGMIYSPTHGELAFTVPLFDKFMVRAIPTFGE